MKKERKKERQKKSEKNDTDLYSLETGRTFVVLPFVTLHDLRMLAKGSPRFAITCVVKLSSKSACTNLHLTHVDIGREGINASRCRNRAETQWFAES